MIKWVEQLHGPDVVPLPGKTAFYTLVERLSVGRHTFGSAVTRRQTANRLGGAVTVTFASRPGEQVQIDSTPLVSDEIGPYRPPGRDVAPLQDLPSNPDSDAN